MILGGFIPIIIYSNYQGEVVPPGTHLRITDANEDRVTDTNDERITDN